MDPSNSWGSTSSASLTSTTSPCETINGAPLDWSGRGTSHVEYTKSETLPLTQGRFLGRGMHGGVYETSCNGIPLAWKRKFCSRRVGQRERREIEIIKRLQHQHIIRLVGTYTHGPFLGLLLWPVATCDLADLMEDVDWLQRSSPNPDQMQMDDEAIEESAEQIVERQARLQALGIDTSSKEAASVDAVAFLESTLGCIASAVAYLHRQDIKHKDLKPSNILLAKDGLWVTDFGTATDFSVLTSSVTEDGERGTPKYFAPEVAIYEASGRAADIFSMGCIFLEIITLCFEGSLSTSKGLRSQNDKSFQANLTVLHKWFSFGRIATRTCADEHFLGLVRSMVQQDPNARPSAELVEEEVALINGFAIAQGLRGTSGYFSRPCCDLMSGREPTFSDRTISAVTPYMDMSLTIGNTYELQAQSLHTYTFFVTASAPNFIEKVHIYLVSHSTTVYIRMAYSTIAPKFQKITLRTRATSVCFFWSGMGLI
jgi:serine/threonine protein kinase